MDASKVINVNENSAEFRKELAQRLKVAKNPLNRIPISQARKNILRKYQELAGAKV